MPEDTAYMQLPYPLDTEKIAKGAWNIEELAEQIEADILIDPKSATDTYTTYPIGISVMATGNTGWPYSTGCVLTYRIKAGSWVTQFFSARTSATGRQATYVRYGYNLSDGSTNWTDWQTIASPGSPAATASGDVMITPVPDTVTTTVVTLPANRFTNQDTGGKLRINTAPNTSSPGVETAASWPSSGPVSSFTIGVKRASSTNTGIHWWATQGGS